jgi:hypothetical protein
MAEDQEHKAARQAAVQNALRQEIEMEGATIIGRRPRFEYINKLGRERVPGSGDHSSGFYTPDAPISGEVFDLPTGQPVVLIPEKHAVQFLREEDQAKTVSGLTKHEGWDPDQWNAAENADDRRVDILKLLGQRGYDQASRESIYGSPEYPRAPDFITHDLGNGFHLVLGATQEYQGESIPIVIYSEPKTGHLEQSYKNPEYVTRNEDWWSGDKGVLGIGDFISEFQDVKPENLPSNLTPGFSGRDIIEGYKTAKAGQRAEPTAPAPEAETPSIEPLPPAKLPPVAEIPPREPKSSFAPYEFEKSTTEKGKRWRPILGKPKPLTDVEEVE